MSLSCPSTTRATYPRLWVAETHWTRWQVPITPAQGKLKMEDPESQVSLGYRIRLLTCALPPTTVCKHGPRECSNLKSSVRHL